MDKVPVAALIWLSTKSMAALVRETLLARQRDGDLDRGVARVLDLALVDHLLVGDDGALVHVGVGVDGIDADDVGEHRRVARDEVAHGDLLAADAAVDGGFDRGEIQVELGGVDGRLRGGHLRIALVAVGGGLVELLLGGDLGGLEVSARVKLRSESSFCACACFNWPCAWSSAAWYGRGSMTKSRSPFLTSAPSLKAILSM